MTAHAPSYRTRRPAARRSRDRGFSLIEVLVSIVVLSFGLLGMVGLQATALKSNRDARLQSVGVSLARELAEMMRANPGVAALATNNPYYGQFSGASLPANSNGSCLDAGANCANATALANAQMTEWLARVGNALPGARVSVCLDAAPYDSGGLPQWACAAPTAAAQNVAYIKLGWTRENMQNTLEYSNSATSRPFVIFPVTPGGQL